MFKHPKQFQILSLINCEIFNCDFSFTNFLLINILSLISFAGFIYYFSQSSGASQDTSIIDDLIQKIREIIREILKAIKKGRKKISRYLLRLLIFLLTKFVTWSRVLLEIKVFLFCLCIILWLLFISGILDWLARRSPFILSILIKLFKDSWLEDYYKKFKK